jgi:hypothetical protein
VSGLVHSSIWPEHAAYTETVSQLTIKHVSLHEYRGINKSCIFRTTKPLDSEGRPLVVSLLPRGVKENSLGDPEYLPGTSILVKSDSCWPSLPTPDRNGNITNTEVHICSLDITIKLPVLLEMATYFSVAVDPRWDSCHWGLGMEQMIASGEVKVINTFPPGSSSVAVVVNGIHASYYPVQLGEDLLKSSTEESKSNGMSYVSLVSAGSSCQGDGEAKKGHAKRVNSLQATQINLDVDLITVQNRHTLDASFLAAMLPAKSQASESHHRAQKDISENQPWEKFSSILPLLSPRLEATLSAIRVSVVTDELDKVFLGAKPMGDATPHYKDIIKPFTLSIFTSLDPIPEKIPDIMDGLNEIFGISSTSFVPSLFATYCHPSNRLFYWPRCPYCIETTYIGIEDFTIDMTLLDLVYLSKTVEVVRDQIKELDVVGWFFTMFPSAGRKRKFDTNSNSALHVPIPQHAARNLQSLSNLAKLVIDSRPNEVYVAKVKNIRVSVLPAVSDETTLVSPTVPVTSPSSLSDTPEQEIVGVTVKSVSLLYEKESAVVVGIGGISTPKASSSSKPASAPAAFLVKAECGGVGLSVSGRPIVFLNVDAIEGLVFRACSSNICPTKWLSETPAILFCYDTRPSFLDSVAASSNSMPNIDDIADIDMDSSNSISAIVNIEAVNGCCLVLQPRSVLLVLQGCVTELLKGVGSVDVNCSYWWQDSIFGFIRTHLDNLIGGDSRKGVLVQMTRQQLVKVAKKVDPVLLTFTSSQARIAVIDVLDPMVSPSNLKSRMSTDFNSPILSAIADAGESPLFFHKPSMKSSNKSSCLLLTVHHGQSIGRLRAGDRPLVALKINSRVQVQLLQFNAIRSEYDTVCFYMRDSFVL